ncbi:MAG: hypothetical protein DME07_00985 [Candidatus Rokuibacteriota bacterium]|nr:MAG: hypothetical protein DME07_00985 [Candidatus Rokubacteria bacterium]
MTFEATPYPEINAVLHELHAGARAILGRQLVGFYLEGSLALGGFAPDRSDIDFVMVTDGECSVETFNELKTMHERIANGASKWARELEGSYISRRALRHDRQPAAHPNLERYSSLVMVRPETGYWIIHRHILREHGIALAGPPPRTLIDPVEPDDLRAAVLGILREWWRPMLVDGPLLRHGGYRRYAVLTMSRMLYTMRHGAITTKPIAATWAEETLDQRWVSLVRVALAPSTDAAPDLDATVAYIGYTCECAERSASSEK